jgi:hypothetical protein
LNLEPEDEEKKQEFKMIFFIFKNWNGPNPGTLTEGEGPVQLTSSLR